MENNNTWGYQGYCDIYQQQIEKRNQILPALFQGVIYGITFQFIGDIIFTIFFSGKNVIKSDVQLSGISEFYAAGVSGAVSSTSAIYMDRYAVAILANVSYVYTNNLVDSLINQKEFEISTDQLVFDIIVTEVIVLLFDKKAKNDYINHYNEHHHINAPKLDSKKSFFDIAFIVIITNTYFSLRR